MGCHRSAISPNCSAGKSCCFYGRCAPLVPTQGDRPGSCGPQLIYTQLMPIMSPAECFMATSVVSEALTSDGSIHEAIVRRAREIWQEHGCIDGHAEEDWAQAEAEIRGRLAAHRTSIRRIVVKAGS